MTDAEHIVVIDGHRVDTRVYPIDRFYDGRTGERVTDAQWDAESAIYAAAESDENQLDN